MDRSSGSPDAEETSKSKPSLARSSRRAWLGLLPWLPVVLGVVAFATASCERDRERRAEKAPPAEKAPGPKVRAGAPAEGFDATIGGNVERLMEEGRKTFRFDTFGSEAFFGDTLQLHRAVAGEKSGGIGPGVSPKTALSVGLTVDVNALPADLQQQLKDGKVNLDDPASTLALLKIDSVVGVKGVFNPDGSLKTMGLTCAVCHSTVDDSFAPGIGRRLDGWPNRDLNPGAILALAPNLKRVGDLLGADVETVKKVLNAWGPGRFDALLDKDGKALRPDGKPSPTLIPPAFGLAGVNAAMWTGFGTVTYWNAYVANTEMHGGPGFFFDPRLTGEQYPVAAKSGSYNITSPPQDDRITEKLAALHFYQLGIPAPKPPAGSFDEAAAERGKAVFEGKARCATCHVPPLYTEPGHNLHKPEEIGVDSFQADRSPTRAYRTAPLKGLWTHTEGGFYHDGRFPTLMEVVNHYDSFFQLKLTESEKRELVEYLKSL